MTVQFLNAYSQLLDSSPHGPETIVYEHAPQNAV